MLKTILNRTFFLSVFLIFGFLFVSSDTLASETSNKAKQSAQETLSFVDNYQKKYFEIIKRNDVLLDLESDKETDKDRKELKKLYKEVKKKVKNKHFLKVYKEIEKSYSKCDAESTIDMNDFASKNFEAFDDLLNAVYKEVKSKISPEDFKKLAASERKWLYEVEKYENVFNSMGFGTISTIIYYGYKTDMTQFRTLLLMMYL